MVSRVSIKTEFPFPGKGLLSDQVETTSVHDNRWCLADADRVVISPKGDSYNEFPTHPGLTNFDKSDRKFVAVANAHPEKPPILQSTDSKWWGWKDALEDSGITVCFLCPEYVKTKYAEKIGE